MQEYRFKFYLNAMHSIMIHGNMGEVHPHTWEIIVDVLKQNNDFFSFSILESLVEDALLVYQDQNLNTIPPFDLMNPTLENVTMYLHKKLEQLFVENGFILSRLEVGETPARSFIIDIIHQERQKSTHDFEQDVTLIEQKADELLGEKLKILSREPNAQETIAKPQFWKRFQK